MSTSETKLCLYVCMVIMLSFFSFSPFLPQNFFKQMNEKAQRDAERFAWDNSDL